jgi:hypothetical protein
MENEQEVVLDGQKVTQEELEEKKKDQAIRVAEKKDKPGEFVTLKKLHG